MKTIRMNTNEGIFTLPDQNYQINLSISTNADNANYKRELSITYNYDYPQQGQEIQNVNLYIFPIISQIQNVSGMSVQWIENNCIIANLSNVKFQYLLTTNDYPQNINEMLIFSENIETNVQGNVGENTNDEIIENIEEEN